MGDDTVPIESRIVVRQEVGLAVLEERIKGNQALVNLRFDLEAKALQIKADADAKALALQYAITEQHLKNLNGEAERLRQMQASYVPREVLDAKLEDIAKAVHILEMSRSEVEGKGKISTPLLVAIALGAGGLIVFLIQLMLSKGGSP